MPPPPLPKRNGPHRVTWPQVLGWLTMAAAAVPVVLAQLAVLHLPAWVQVAGTCFVAVVGVLTRSPQSPPKSDTNAMLDENAALRASLPPGGVGPAMPSGRPS